MPLLTNNGCKCYRKNVKCNTERGNGTDIPRRPTIESISLLLHIARLNLFDFDCTRMHVQYMAIIAAV